MEELSGGRITSVLPAIVVLIPFVSAVIAFFLTRFNRRAGEVFTVLSIAVVFTAIFSMYSTVTAGHVIYGRYAFLSLPFTVSVRFDALSFFLAMVISFLWLLAALHSIGYMEKEHAHDRYYGLLLVCMGGCLGTVVTGDLIGLFLFFEIMALASFALVSHEEHPYAMFAGVKYLFMSVGAGLAIFFGIVITYFIGGSVSLSEFGLISEVSTLSFIAFISFVLGFGIKAGIFPVHVWLPDAHPAAPAPVSALLSGVMIKVGAYGLIRVFYQVFGFEYLQALGWERITLILAVITILLGSALALIQDDIKRRLAYSSVAQIGYILLGISMLSERALTGGVYHIFTHAFMKGGLFLIAGAIILRTGERRISHMGGVGFKMPLTMIAFTLCSLSMVGIPPFNGFVSKWQLALGALDIGQPMIVVLLIVSSLLNAAYYFPIVIAAFFAAPKEEGLEAGTVSGAHGTENSGSVRTRMAEAPLNMLIPIGILAIGSIAFVLMPQNWPLEMAQAVVRELFVKF